MDTKEAIIDDLTKQKKQTQTKEKERARNQDSTSSSLIDTHSGGIMTRAEQTQSIAKVDLWLSEHELSVGHDSIVHCVSTRRARADMFMFGRKRGR